MKIAIEGCCHGELDKIYETLAYLEEVNNIKVDLLLICGDFQSVRNKADLHCMAVPTKYQCMNTFYKYYSGEKKAPILTVFIGGNHEASNYLQELPYGGWVAPNIFYMGYANVICFGGLRIAGLSGIYKAKDYRLGHFERPPYSEDTKRSVYHVRNVEVFRLKQISRPLDIVLSHDWPRGIYNFGNVNTLLNRKPFFREQVESDTLGSPPAEELLYKLQPDYWFSAHLHTKFAAHVEHQTEGVGSKTTKFLSLDKCLPRRQFLQVLDFPHDEAVPLKLKLDPEWLCILKSTNHLLSLKRSSSFMPGPGCSEKWDFRISDEEIESIKEDFGNDLTIPENFTTTVPAYTAEEAGKRVGEYAPPSIQVNPQTTLLCTMLELSDPNAMFLGLDSSFALQPDDAANLSSAQESDEDVNSDGNETDDVNATYESSIDVTFNSSFNPEEIPLDNEEDDEGISEMENESEANISTASSGAGDEEECLASRLSGVNSIDQSSELREDDDELKSTLAEQGASRSTDRITVGEIIVENVNETDSVLTGAMASTCQPVTSAIVATSPRQPSGSENEKSSQDEGDDDEFQAIMAAQSKQKTSPSQSDVSFDGDKSALVESSSSSRALASKQKYDMNKTVDTEVLPTSKKLKRRNLTMYSGGEDV